MRSKDNVFKPSLSAQLNVWETGQLIIQANMWWEEYQLWLTRLKRSRIPGKIGDAGHSYRQLMLAGLLFLLVNENEEDAGRTYERSELAAGEKGRAGFRRSLKTTKQERAPYMGLKDVGNEHPGLPMLGLGTFEVRFACRV